jgi:3',5'-nucleoside bisphosphate phosphatase
VFAAAAAAELDWFALTDHDTLAGWQGVSATQTNGVTLIRGIELSTVWSGVGIHIVGLNVDVDNPVLRAGVALQQQARAARAERITQVLRRAGFTLELASIEALSEGSPGRPHFAEYLVNTGQVATRNLVFRRYLGAGKAGDIKTGWAALDEVVAWIRAAGGIATLAHPSRYKLSRTKLRRLVDTFAQCGGGALEVISGRQPNDVTAHLAQLSHTCGLLASCGSDFHSPEVKWAPLGMPLNLPRMCEPVWTAWQ